jgi:glucose/mannose transport system permease protein
VLVHVVFAMPIMTLMFRNYFATLPIEIFKAARVDGAGFWRIFASIMMPMAKPIIVVAVIWQATASWNDYLLGLVFAGREHLPMTAQLNLLVSAEMGAHEYNVDMAATLQTALVPLVIYFVSGKWFARGIAAGAVKG